MPGVFRRVGLGMSLQAWSQLSGMNIMMYYITYVFQGAGLTGRRGNLIASSVQYVLNVAFTVPAIIYIDKWGRRPMMIIGFALLGVFLFLVGGLQGGYGHWDRTDPSARACAPSPSRVSPRLTSCARAQRCGSSRATTGSQRPSSSSPTSSCAASPSPSAPRPGRTPQRSSP